MTAVFENFNLHIEKTSGKDSFVASIQDDKGSVLVKNEFRYRIDPYILTKLEDSVGRDISDNARLIKDFGSELFNTVFDGEVLGYYKSRTGDEKYTRLKLFFKQEEPELLRIPWEFMFDGTKFLSTYPKITMTRVLKGIPSDNRGKIKGKLKMLAVISSPIDLPEHHRLQIEKEQMIILQAVDRIYASNTIDVEFLDEASLKNIQDKLDDGAYHIFHYTGHGAYSGPEDKGYLLLEDDFGNAKLVDNERVADLLAGYNSLLLVVLSGCQTAKTSGRRVFSDLTTPLLIRKIPAIISMQYSITDQSAISLARKLYSEICEGVPIDLALTNGRKELFINKEQGTVDFATPVLFCDEPNCLQTEKAVSEPEKESFASVQEIKIKQNIVLGLEQLGTQFIGRRKEIRRVKEDFFARGIRAVILHGIGGIGKTVTATKIAEKFQSSFSGVFAFDCREGLTAEEILIKLNDFLKRIGVNELDNVCNAPIPIEVKINDLAQVLSQIKLLLIFDNCETLLKKDEKSYEIADKDLKKGLKALVIQCKDGTKFLFTSRYTFNLTDSRLTNVMDEINLGELSRPEAIMVMNKFPDIAKEEFDTKVRIYERIGGHPYTINIFGQHAKHKSINDVLMDIAQVNKEMVEFTLLDMSYANLSETAKELINRISVFKKKIALEGLEWMMKDNGRSPELTGEVEELIHWGLITTIDEKGASFYHVHTIVKDFIKMKVKYETRKLWLIKAAQYYENLMGMSPSLWDPLDARELYFEAEEYDKAGIIVENITEHLYTWGFIELVRKLNEETIVTANDQIKASAYHYIGMVHQDQGEYEKAVKKYDQSLKIKEKIGDKGGIAKTLGQLGNIHLLQGEYENAIAKYTQSLEIARDIGDKRVISSALHQIGIVYQEQGEYEQAIQKYTKSLKIAEEIGDKGSIARSLHHLGIIHQEQGEYEQAIQQYTKSLKIAEEIGDKSSISKTLHQLGNIYFLQEEDEKATEKYNQSLKIKEKLGDKSGIIFTLGALGTILARQGKYEKAIENYNLCMKLSKELGDKSINARILHNIGMIHQEQGEHEKAIEKYTQSLKIKEELGNKSGIASTRSQLGSVYESKGEYKSALKHYLISFSTFQTLRSPHAEDIASLINGLKEKIGKDTFDKIMNDLGRSGDG